jgi:glycine hydroxymethyltransferase
MTMLERRNWVPKNCEDFVQNMAASIAGMDADSIEQEIDRLAGENRVIHEHDCINLNPGSARARRWAIPATNTRWAWRRSRRSR